MVNKTEGQSQTGGTYNYGIYVHLEVNFVNWGLKAYMPGYVVQKIILVI